MFSDCIILYSVQWHEHSPLMSMTVSNTQICSVIVFCSFLIIKYEAISQQFLYVLLDLTTKACLMCEGHGTSQCRWRVFDIFKNSSNTISINFSLTVSRQNPIYPGISIYYKFYSIIEYIHRNKSSNFHILSFYTKHLHMSR